jgi:transcription elongation GreA/GreB family factor
MDELKSRLMQHLKALLVTHLQEMTDALAAAKDSRDGETKSTVGDKYETGRAMAQIEIQKLEQQMFKIQQMRQELTMAEKAAASRQASFGSLVTTDQGTYLLAIPFGKLVVDEVVVYAVSMASPLGAALAGKQVADTFSFNGRSFRILRID